jgi:hypothetical protein
MRPMFDSRRMGNVHGPKSKGPLPLGRDWPCLPILFLKEEEELDLR